MVATEYDGSTGRTVTTQYTKFYAVGEWLKEGELGLDAWIDHEKDAVPFFDSLRRATGTLGSDDLKATGLVTLYFVNLSNVAVPIRVLKVANKLGEPALSQPNAIDLAPRSVTRMVVGRFPILNYATEVKVSVDYETSGQTQAKEITIKRLSDIEYGRYSGRSGRPPYPWFSAPYFPFDPPMRGPDSK
jgi:hypothetical protein